MAPLFDVRPGEARGQLVGFASLLMLVIGAHTILETARDALLLTGPGPRALGLVYMAIAACTVPSAAVASRLGERFGQRRALGGLLVVAVMGPALLFVLPASHAAAVATYVLSGVLGSIVIPQFWTLVGMVLTVSQGRRLFGLISAAGIVGGVIGPAAASAALLVLPVKSLLLVSSCVFALAIGALQLVRVSNAEAPGRHIPVTASLRSFREQPFLLRVALVVLLSTATFLVLDYLFKSSVARALPASRVAPFVAHCYLALNVASLVVQLGVSGAVIRRLGVLPALVVTPLLLIGGALTSFAGGGALPGVLAVKAVDGSLRYSVHRVSGELMYLPVPSTARQRTKPLIDGGLARLAQTVTGAGLLALGGTSLLAPRPLSILVAGLACAWLLTVLTMRRPYLNLLRSAVTSGYLNAPDDPQPLDLETAQILLQRLASEEPMEVEAAMLALSRRGRPGLVPALVLLHQDEGVLVQALDLFGASDRSDWLALGRRLLSHEREAVRIAAARALARHEQLDPSSLSNDVGWRARGYAAVRIALRDASTPLVEHSSIAALLDATGDPGSAARLGMLAAIADAQPSARLSPLLFLLAREPTISREQTELLAAAAAHQRDARIVPALISMLTSREGREAVRAALVELGQPAFDEVLRTLRDRSTPVRLRLHVPKTLARFGTRRAVEGLLATIESEGAGFVRYKCIRALRWLVIEGRVAVDRRRAERQACADMEMHFRWSALCEDLAQDTAKSDEALRALLEELLKEKAAHALERAFQLLQIAHPHQGLHHAYLALRSKDAYARANAAELVDALLRRRDQQRLRTLFRLASDELTTAERVARARATVAGIPHTPVDRLSFLAGRQDAMLEALVERLTRAPESRPSLRVLAGGR